jgi:hypothetical protein
MSADDAVSKVAAPVVIGALRPEFELKPAPGERRAVQTGSLARGRYHVGFPEAGADRAHADEHDAIPSRRSPR